ncbi:MAG: methyltransferase domain-containing protein [Deltaproteobacteria bacterium]|nr:methyltransferase domain-containing protein [Deltaproteobacteria bacterium]
MTNPKDFYGYLWDAKQQANYRPAVRRHWFHRLILDPIFDPSANPRHEVALRLLQGGERLLDIGCWNGYLLERIREKNIYRELYGVDIVPEAIETVRAKFFKAHVVDLNKDPLPFHDDFFDGVTMLAVLEHIFDPYAVIQEVRRVLRPGGQLVIDVPNAASLTNRMRILLGRIPVTSTDRGWDGGHLHYFTKHALDRLLREEGFDILQRKTTGGKPWLRERWISLLGGELIYLCRKR